MGEVTCMPLLMQCLAVLWWTSYVASASRTYIRPSETSILFGVQRQRGKFAVSKLALHCTQVSGVHSAKHLAQHWSAIMLTLVLKFMIVSVGVTFQSDIVRGMDEFL